MLVLAPPAILAVPVRVALLVVFLLARLALPDPCGRALRRQLGLEQRGLLNLGDDRFARLGMLGYLV